MKKLIAGNWKMNGSLKMASELIGGIASNARDLKCDLLLCVPFPYLSAAGILLNGKDGIAVGAQDCSAHEIGAYTGEVSSGMLRDMGASAVIVGHSERREYHGEGDALVRAKAEAAHKHGLTAIICVGETLEQRKAGDHESVVAAQIEGSVPAGATPDNTVIAYEPVWAIGTGEVASPEDVAAMHGFIRTKFAGRILYGGSMKPDNAEALLSTPNVDGGLIGGASLQAESFLAIAKAA